METPSTVYGLSMDYPYTHHGATMDPSMAPPWSQNVECPWNEHGPTMNCTWTVRAPPWTAHGLSTDLLWTVQGPTMVLPWTVHGPTMEAHGPP